MAIKKPASTSIYRSGAGIQSMRFKRSGYFSGIASAAVGRAITLASHASSSLSLFVVKSESSDLRVKLRVGTSHEQLYLLSNAAVCSLYHDSSVADID